jgi:hypothetical protein
LRDKRSDPSSRANAPPKAGADPGTCRRWGDDLPTRQIRVRRDATGRWFPNRAKRPHPILPPGDRRDGPAARPQTPLAVENSVGELTANPHRLSAKCQYPGKRAWRAPTPNFEKPRGREIAGFFVFRAEVVGVEHTEERHRRSQTAATSRTSRRLAASL